MQPNIFAEPWTLVNVKYVMSSKAPRRSCWPKTARAWRQRGNHKRSPHWAMRRAGASFAKRAAPRLAALPVRRRR
eukprot:8097180-Pyramimonas_sp.AAC.1